MEKTPKKIKSVLSLVPPVFPVFPVLAVLLAGALLFGCVQQQPAATPSVAPSAAPSASATQSASATPAPTPAARAAASVAPSLAPSAAAQAGAPSLEELAETVGEIASDVAGAKIELQDFDGRAWTGTYRLNQQTNYFVSVGSPLHDSFDSSDSVAVLEGFASKASKRVALYEERFADYVRYDVKQFCYGKKFLVETKTSEQRSPSGETTGVGEKLARKIIDACPE